MRRVLDRLDVFILGDRLHKTRTVEIVYRERMEREVGFGEIDIPEPPIKRTGEIRHVRNVVDASPNAPLLKRVVQHPFALEKGDFQRAKIPRCHIEGRKRIEFPKFVQEELRKPFKIRTIRPMEMHYHPQTPVIPSVDSWLQSNKRKGRF